MLERHFLETLFYKWYPILLLFLYVAVAVRLGTTGLFKAYRQFTYYLVFSSLQYFGLLFVTPRTFAFGLLYFGTMPISWLLQLAVILELFRGVLASHTGLRTTSRRFILYSFTGSLFCSAASLILTPLAGGRELLFQFLIAGDRVWQSTTTFFLILLTAFLAFFPVPINRNRWRHATILFLLFVTRTVALILITTQNVEFILFANVAAATVEIACLSGWLLLMTKAGEKTFARSNWVTTSPEQEEKLIFQLEELNNRLLGSAKEYLHQTDLQK